MQYYAEQLILFSKSSTSTTPLSSLQLPPNGHLNHHPISNSNPTQPSQPHAVITAPLSTSYNGSNSSITPGFKKQPQETGRSVPEQPLVIHPPSNFTPPSNTSSFPGDPSIPSSTSSTGHMDDPDPDTDTEDADTSTDAGTETDCGSETDEEPTIRAPPTVAGSVGSRSVWGDEADERMASP